MPLNEIPKRTGTFQSYDGTSIYYEDRGSGRPIILCYGLACLMNHWTHQIRYFSQNYRVIAFDYRGHHNSGTPTDPTELSVDALMKDIKGLVDHLELTNASFWGHSYGVQLLLRYYDLYPETVKNLVFINGFATNPIRGMFGQLLGPDAITKVFRAFQEGYRLAPEPLTALWRATVMNPLSIPVAALAGGFNLSLTSIKDIEVYARGVASLDVELFMKLFEEMMEYDGTAVLEKIKVPTLIVSGSKDGVTPASHQYAMQKKIRGSELLRVPYGSHCTQLDLPEFVNLRIEKFLNQHLYS
ncbi:MAG: alpha/beta hydrolase [Bdellovibrionales bacterium]|jgi:pimeloyl-ACP methyl ester carboxylesterase|nr:alpha/beta hydrolase [Bdellovibrionales bacterium]